MIAGERLSDGCKRYGEKIAVGIDAKDGQVQVKGWTETTGVESDGAGGAMSAMGVKTIIYTGHGARRDVARRQCRGHGRDLRRRGVPRHRLRRCQLRKRYPRLVALGKSNLTGAIVGKALYENRVTIEELKEVV
jgi:phosphoribosylformimino-5-aminoimidazole carboxamide ribotide isomerase